MMILEELSSVEFPIVHHFSGVSILWGTTIACQAALIWGSVELTTDTRPLDGESST
jgi:hypothetical protein